MGTSRAHHRRAGGQRPPGGLPGFGGALSDPGSNDLGGKLSDPGQKLLTRDLQAEGPKRILQIGFQLLNHDKPLHLGREIPEGRIGQRIRHPQLEEGRVRQRLPGVLIGHAAAHDPQVRIAHFHPVVLERLRKVLQEASPFLHQNVPCPGVGRDHHRLAGILLICLRLKLQALPKLDNPLAVAYARRHPQHHRGIEPLAELIREHREILRLLAVRRLQHRDLRHTSVEPVVLLVLGAVHAGIVGRHEHEAGIYPRVRSRHQRVRRHVDAHVLHHGQRALAAQRSAERDLEGHLLVDRPFGVDVRLVRRHVLEDFGAGRSGIGRRDLHTGLERAPGDRGIS